MNLYIDIETTPDLSEGALQRCIDAAEPPGQYKKPESIAEWKAQNAAPIGAQQWGRTALDPMRGGVYCIGYSFDGEDARTLYRQPQEPEGPYLDAALSAIFAQIDKDGQQHMPRWVGWNVMGFDVPFLAKRCAILGIVPRLRIPTGQRYNNDHILDLMLAWSGFKDFNSQRSVAEAMGIPLLCEVDGKDLWSEVQVKGVDVAAAKCRSDIGALIAIHQRMAPVFRV